MKRAAIKRLTIATGAALASLFACAFAVTAMATETPASCANELIRSQLGSLALPDCRAYEMATPPYKEGYPMFPNSFSSDGEKMILRSFATVAGEQGWGEIAFGGAFYLGTRTPNGWLISPLNPPQSELAGQFPIAQEADNGESLWVGHALGQPASTANLYVRAANGSLSMIGSLNLGPVVEDEASTVFNTSTSYNHPIGATSDYMHVVLHAGREAPLYEYSGTNNLSPVLVGVEGGKGSSLPIGECGIDFGGSGQHTAFNALSRDGETIFFTEHSCSASVPDAIFARIHGALTSLDEAETVEISESECTTSCGGESGKNFEGASEDGRLVYFASTQKLTDDAVDGTASGDAATEECRKTPSGLGGCNLYQYSFNKPTGQRLSLVYGGEVLGVAGISEDGSHVYFVARSALASAVISPYGSEPQAELPNLYVYDASSGKTSFIATLGGGDSADWQKEETRRPVEIAGTSGQYMLFRSSTPNITPDDTSTQAQLFEYKAQTSGEPAELVRVTQGENGFAENGNGVSAGVAAEDVALGLAVQGGQGFDIKSTTNHLLIADDGQTVFFSTAGQLSARATSAARGCQSVYEFHAPDGALADGTVSLISDGREVQLYKGARCGALLQKTDATGSNVLFQAADPLLSGDVDGGQVDLYDARVDGGFAPAEIIGTCGSGLCEASPSGAPALPVASSGTEDGESPQSKPKSAAAIKKKKGGGARTKKRVGEAKRCKPRKGRVVGRCRRAAHRGLASKSVLSHSGRGK